MIPTVDLVSRFRSASVLSRQLVPTVIVNDRITAYVRMENILSDLKGRGEGTLADLLAEEHHILRAMQTARAWRVRRLDRKLTKTRIFIDISLNLATRKEPCS